MQANKGRKQARTKRVEVEPQTFTPVASPPMQRSSPTSNGDAPAPFVSPKFTEERMRELDDKYRQPELMGHFTCYFGKYRQKASFEEVTRDQSYTKFISTLTPKTSNMYLFQRYIASVAPPQTL